jgi:alkaline phosphatase
MTRHLVPFSFRCMIQPACLILGCLLSDTGCHPSNASCSPMSTASNRLPVVSAPTVMSDGPRHVILLLSDGTGPEAMTLARWVKGSSLNVDGILTGAIRTYGADSIVTDSAPGASAYATGKKGSCKGISVGAWHNTVALAPTDPQLAYVPLVTLLEGARVSGYATGLVATSSIQHATPAAFSAHVAERDQYDEIAEQQVYQGIDVVLGGGAKHLLPRSMLGGTRADGEQLVDILRQRGYRYVTTNAELLASMTGRTWGAFASDAMAYEIDRQRFAPTEPSLSEMTDFAIANLAASDRGKNKGFFLFVEGSKVDWSAHDNDPVGVVSDLLAFDAAVGKALQFAKSNSSTLVVVVADHGTGGLTIGAASDPNYALTDDDVVVGPLRRAQVTAERLDTLLSATGNVARMGEVIRTEWGITDLSERERFTIAQAIRNKASAKAELARLISVRAHVGWTTNGHTGADVQLYAFGPAHPTGLVENTEIGQGIAKYLGLDFDHLQRRLFVDARAALATQGYSVSLDRSDPQNGLLVVAKGEKRAKLPWAKNHLIIDHHPHDLEGIVVFSDKLDRVFIPQQAVDQLVRELP